MEYCEGGDISQLISKCKKNGEYISEEMLWKIFTQILKMENYEFVCQIGKGNFGRISKIIRKSD